MPRAHRSRPDLETLDERLVPAAAILDLSTAGSTAFAPNGALVQQTNQQPTGTGFIHSFVRVQGAAPGGGSEQGYNTDARPLQFDENKSPVFTRSLQLSEVPIVVVNGVAYREFLLDINQKSSSPLLSLDEVRVFLGSTGNMTGYDTTTHQLAGQDAVFDLDSGGDVAVKLNAGLTHGSGSGDMLLDIPAAAFAGADPNSFVYLYSKFGVQAGMTANAGFEEWAVKTGGGTTNPTGNASLSGSVIFDANQNHVFTDPGDHGISGVTITLQGVNDLGLNVVLTTTTDMNGNYTFTGLRAGTYTIQETQPAGLSDGLNYVGTVNGVTDGVEGPDTSGTDTFLNIQLATNQQGINYIFTEWVNENG
jgi:SdrD B-like domain